MNFDKKNNLTQSIGCFFDDAEPTIIAGTAQGICKAKEQPEDLPLVFPSPILPSICRHSLCRESTYVKRMGKSFIIPRDLPIFIYQNFT